MVWKIIIDYVLFIQFIRPRLCYPNKVYLSEKYEKVSWIAHLIYRLLYGRLLMISLEVFLDPQNMVE